MNDSNPTPNVAKPVLDPVSVFAALGSEFRWPVVMMLGDGRRMAVGEIAAQFARNLDGVGRHMTVLRDAGVVETVGGEDRRQIVYQIPAVFRRERGVLDFGVCVVELG